MTLQFGGYGDYAVTLAMTYRVGLSTLSVPARVTVRVVDREPAGDGGVGDGGGGGGGGEPAGGCCGAGGGQARWRWAPRSRPGSARRRRWHR
ncbi:MAG: hypothetical protein R3B06_05375 [Kofleriaceae bacterium]